MGTMPERWRCMLETRIYGILCTLYGLPCTSTPWANTCKCDCTHLKIPCFGISPCNVYAPCPTMIRGRRGANGRIALIGCRMIFHLSQIQGTGCSIDLEPRNIESYFYALKLRHISSQTGNSHFAPGCLGRSCQTFCSFWSRHK